MKSRWPRVVIAALLAASLWLAVAPSRAIEVPQAAAPEWRWTGVGRVVAFGDVHGAYAELTTLLRATGIIDERGSWIAGDTHVVSLGDLVDRGADSRKVLDLLMRLEDEARGAGGRFHAVLGNHEMMNVLGDLRYVTRGEYLAFADEEDPQARQEAYRQFLERRVGAEISEQQARKEFEKRYPPGYFAHRLAFSPDGRYGSWLMQRPTLVVIDRTAFLHGGVSSIVADLGAEELNRRLLAEVRAYLGHQHRLEAAGLLMPFTSLQERQRTIAVLLAAPPDTISGDLRSAALAMQELPRTLAVGGEGPLWYRGTARNDAIEEEPILDQSLARLDVDRVVLGHTTTEDRWVRSRFDGRVLLIDSGMQTDYYKGRPAALVLEDEAVRVFYSMKGGRYEDPRPEPIAAAGTVPASFTDGQLERFLETAEVVKIEEIGTGITNPQRLTLRQGGVEARAVFKSVDSTPATRSLLEKINRSDRYTYEIAAYRLDRMLGIGMVPVTVERRVGRKRGAVQFWIEDAIDERERVDRNAAPEDLGIFRRQTRLMHLFDILIFNSDRNQQNMLYTPADGRLHMIDHTRAFRVNTGRPRSARNAAIQPSAELKQRLEALDLPTLKQKLKGLIQPVQIKSILKRRDQLLKDATPPS